MTQEMVLLGLKPPDELVRIKSDLTWPLVLGRSSQCDIVVEHNSVSRRHANLELHWPYLRVVDLGSQNGTFVDGSRGSYAQVITGQRLQFGAVPCLVDSMESDSQDIASDLSTALTIGPERLAPGEQMWKSLSSAQMPVFRLLTTGLNEKEIAEILRKSPHTIHNHIKEIYRLLGVHSRGEFMALVIDCHKGSW